MGLLPRAPFKSAPILIFLVIYETYSTKLYWSTAHWKENAKGSPDNKAELRVPFFYRPTLKTQWYCFSNTMQSNKHIYKLRVGTSLLQTIFYNFRKWVKHWWQFLTITETWETHIVQRTMSKTKTTWGWRCKIYAK